MCVSSMFINHAHNAHITTILHSLPSSASFSFGRPLPLPRATGAAAQWSLDPQHARHGPSTRAHFSRPLRHRTRRLRRRRRADKSQSRGTTRLCFYGRLQPVWVCGRGWGQSRVQQNRSVRQSAAQSKRAALPLSLSPSLFSVNSTHLGSLDWAVVGSHWGLAAKYFRFRSNQALRHSPL
jgi:hypothetical protein